VNGHGMLLEQLIQPPLPSGRQKNGPNNISGTSAKRVVNATEPRRHKPKDMRRAAPIMQDGCSKQRFAQFPRGPIEAVSSASLKA
jgi:hypothetical protein